MSNTPLHISMKQIADNHGVEVFSDLRLFYLLSDYSSFDSLDDSSIVKGLQEGGFGDILVGAVLSRDDIWKKEARQYLTAFIRANSFDSSQVKYVADAMAYSLGLSSEPSLLSDTGSTNDDTNDKSWYARLSHFCKRIFNSIAQRLNNAFRWLDRTWRQIIHWFKHLPAFWKYFLYGIGILFLIAVAAIILYYLFILVFGLIAVGVMAKKK